MGFKQPPKPPDTSDYGALNTNDPEVLNNEYAKVGVVVGRVGVGRSRRRVVNPDPDTTEQFIAHMAELKHESSDEEEEGGDG